MDTNTLLLQIASLLQMHGSWQARAVDSNLWGQGASPQAAMEQALALRDGARADDDLGDLF